MSNKKQEFEFNCDVCFDGFEVGNEFDSDALIRAFGNRSGEQIASLNFVSKENYKVEVSFFSIGDQSISVCVDDKSVEIAKKFYDEDGEPTKEQLEEFLEDFENTFNMCELYTKNQPLMYEELNKEGLINYSNSSWISPMLEIVDTDDFVLYDDWYDDDVLSSMEECKPVSFSEIQQYYVDEVKEHFNKRENAS